MPKNSIITPVYGRSDLTTSFIRTIANHLTDDDELLIIDNASPDNTETAVKILLGYYQNKNIRYYKNITNLGFGKANNIGAELSTGKNLFFISNDVDIYAEFIRPVEAFLEQDQRVLLGPRVITWETGWNNIWNEVSVIPYVEGWFMATHRKLFETVGGFDPDIFIDYEDIDLSFRMHLAGVALAQINLPVFHPMPGSSFTQLSQKRIEFTNKAIEHFGKKWGFTRK